MGEAKRRGSELQRMEAACLRNEADQRAAARMAAANERMRARIEAARSPAQRQRVRDVRQRSMALMALCMGLAVAGGPERE